MKKILPYIGILTLFASCQKTPDELNVIAQTITFNQVGKPVEGGTFEIASNTSWTATPNAGWVHVNKESGSGNQTITVTVDPGTEDRTSSVTVQAGGIVKTVPVSQVFDVLVEMDDEIFREYCKTATYFDQHATEIGFDSNNDGILSLSEAAAVNRIDVPSKGIASLRGIEYFTGIEILYCGDNTITSLDLRKNTKLTDLHCYLNRLTDLNIYGCSLLRDLECGNNELSLLNISTNLSLKILTCSENKITSLDASMCTGLNQLNYSNNGYVTAVDISGCRQLSKLSIGHQGHSSKTTVYVWPEFDTTTPSNSIADITYGNGEVTSWIKK